MGPLRVSDWARRVALLAERHLFLSMVDQMKRALLFCGASGQAQIRPSSKEELDVQDE